ncbi:hypothetical protein Bbelb_068420 [Branchiostoma belcheri]|nr:hypothetical protein Bbelb_068420 [Branchiostoma belcheri]
MARVLGDRRWFKGDFFFFFALSTGSAKCAGVSVLMRLVMTTVLPDDRVQKCQARWLQTDGDSCLNLTREDWTRPNLRRLDQTRPGDLKTQEDIREKPVMTGDFCLNQTK